ncbi:MAG: hypothetical protein HKN29_07720 [Rhodothermales bacterium]|nr:hypothetical protein [Rhodothermales bacterium]
MARIPASHISDNPTGTGDHSASRRVIKSGRLGLPAGRVLIGAPSRAAEPARVEHGVQPAPAAAVNGPSVEELQQRLASTQRSMERRIAKEVAEAREAALEEGFAKGQAAATEHLETERQALLKAVAGVDRAWETLSDNCEPLLAELAFKMCESILQSPLPEQLRTLSTGALSDALESLSDSKSVQVSLHPADYMMLDESGVLVPLTRNHPNIVWRTDASLERGDWEASSDEAVIRRVARELLADLRGRLSHLDGEEG